MKRLLPTLITLAFPIYLFATHNIAGNITYTQIGDLSIEATITTFTKASSVPADRDSLEICWGDGYCGWVQRSNGTGEILANDIKVNRYTIAHTYANDGDYTISMQDPNRNAGIQNINPPNSDNVEFALQTSFTLGSDYNSSPVLLQHPIDIAFLGQPFIHVPDAYDIDGDSIAYRITTPYMAIDAEVPNYISVTDIVPGPDNQLLLDEETGYLKWNAPQVLGLFNITMEILTYRNGVQNGRIIRDMQIMVKDEANLLPTLNSDIAENEITDVEVGQTITFRTTTSDSENIGLTITSGLFNGVSQEINFAPDNFNDVATITTISNTGNSIETEFNWEVKTEHIRDQPYSVVFKSYDDRGFANYAIYRFKAKMISNNDEIFSSSVNLYPNPVSDVLHFDFKESDKPTSYTIYNTIGKKVQAGILNTNYLNVQQLPKGTYYMYWENTGTQRFIKQ